MRRWVARKWTDSRPGAWLATKIGSSMLLSLWRTLHPFQKTFKKQLWLVAAYESLQIINSMIASVVIYYMANKPPLYAWCLIVVGIYTLWEVAARLDVQVLLKGLLAQTFPIEGFLKAETFKKFMFQRVPWHEQNNSASLMGKAMHGIDYTHVVLDVIRYEVQGTAIQMVYTFVPFLLLAPLTVAIIMVGMVPFVWISVIGSRYSTPLKRQRHDLYQQDWESIQFIQAIRTAKVFGQRLRLYHDYVARQNEITRLANEEFEVSVGSYHLWKMRIINAVGLCCIVYWVIQNRYYSLSTYQAIFLFTGLGKMTSSFWRFGKLIERLNEARESIMRMLGFHQLEDEDMRDHLEDLPLPDRVSVELTKVTYFYPDGKKALDDVDCVIPAGSVVALAGVSGGGKSTAMKVIPGIYTLDQPNSGDVLIAGRSINDYPVRQLETMFSYIPPSDSVDIISDTVLANLRFGNPHATLEEVIAATKLACIHDYFDSPDVGYDKLLGERGIKLSSGQKQRLGIARAVLSRARVLLIDEMTSALDVETEERIMENLRKWAAESGVTILIIAHRLTTIADFADIIYVMEAGRIVEFGTHSELTTIGGKYADMVAKMSFDTAVATA